MFAPAAKGLDRAGSKLGKRRRTEYLDVDYVMPAMPGARIVPAVVSAVAELAICCCHPQAGWRGMPFAVLQSQVL